MMFPAGFSHGRHRARQGGSSKGWWSRNWKWAVPLICFAGVVVIIASIGLLFMLIFGAIKSSDVYQQAMNTAVSNEHVAQSLGAPVETGWFVNGTIRTTGPSGFAQMTIPLDGRKASGTLNVVASKVAGQWHFQVLELTVNNSHERLDLLAPQESP